MMMKFCNRFSVPDEVNEDQLINMVDNLVIQPHINSVTSYDSNDEKNGHVVTLHIAS